MEGRVDLACVVMLWGRCLESTQSDYIEFSNFNVPLTDRKMPKLCGKGSYYSVQSDGSFFRVTFKTNDIFDGTGFTGRYEFKVHRQGIIIYSFLINIVLYWCYLFSICFIKLYSFRPSFMFFIVCLLFVHLSSW